MTGVQQAAPLGDWQQLGRCAKIYGLTFSRQPIHVQQDCCNLCPVQVECLAYGLNPRNDYDESGPGRYGLLPIFGGTTRLQRDRMRQAVADRG